MEDPPNEFPASVSGDKERQFGTVRLSFCVRF